ncbi:hypothetical protein [Lichenicola sp.]|uniref:hypothetical protein n=1 Tax=Lichenicola sp. TaxID=2804529 RepID=UPI003B0043C0
MNSHFRIGASILFLTAGLACTGQAEAQPYGYAPIPPPQYEAPPPPPPVGPRMIWQRGGWEWIGGRYVWAPGHYVAWRPHYGAWVPGHWARRGFETVWIPAHWR